MKNRTAVITVVVIVLLGVAYFAFDYRSKTSTDMATTTPEVGTTTPKVNVSAEGTGDFTITPVPVDEGRDVPQPIPSLNRNPVFSNASLSAETKESISKKISDLEASLNKEPNSLQNWVELGLYFKSAGDYANARDMWVYAGKLSPDNFVSFGNLGDLFAYYLHDNVQAESNFKTAIANGPKMEYLYIQFASFYTDVLKDVSKAKAIVDQGLKMLPNNENLLRLKTTLSASSN